jgi:hypothetical protein
MSTIGKNSCTFTLLFSFLILISKPAYCDEQPIALLTDFSGTVLVKSHGEWAVKSEKNLPLYSQDKVVTRIGTAVITFNNGATVEIKKNSNLLIREREEQKGIFKKVKVVKRRILLLMGKMFFTTGSGQVQTQFETAKTVMGIRGTAGILSIGEDGEIYIEFTEGGAKFIAGEYVDGVAKEVSKEIIDQHPIQKASYLAYIAFERCREAEEKSARGELSPVQAQWFCARASEITAQEVQIWSETLIESNPHTEVVEWAEEQHEEAEIQTADAQVAQEQAIEAGAVPLPEVYVPPGAEIEAEPQPEPEVEAEAEPEVEPEAEPEAEDKAMIEGYEPPPEAEGFESTDEPSIIEDLITDTPITDEIASGDNTI